MAVLSRRARPRAVGSTRPARRRAGRAAHARVRAVALGGRAAALPRHLRVRATGAGRALEVRAEVVRPGRRVQLLEGSIAAGGVEVVRARALQVQAAAAQAAPTTNPPPPGPEHGGPRELRAPHRPMFAPDAIEIRFVNGEWAQGPCTAWFRLDRPDRRRRGALAAAATRRGRRLRQRDQRDAVLGRLPVHQPRPHAVRRARAGRRLDRPGSQNADRGGGVGLAESVLYDLRGRVGRATQALLVAPR